MLGLFGLERLLKAELAAAALRERRSCSWRAGCTRLQKKASRSEKRTVLEKLPEDVPSTPNHIVIRGAHSTT